MIQILAYPGTEPGKCHNLPTALMTPLSTLQSTNKYFTLKKVFYLNARSNGSNMFVKHCPTFLDTPCIIH